MGLNFVVPINLMFEVGLLAIQSYAITFHEDPIDGIFIGLIATYFLFSVVWLFYFKKKGRTFLCEIRIFRGLQGLILVAVGAILLYASEPIKNLPECRKIESSLRIQCHRFVPKLITGTLGLLNALVYFANPCKKDEKVEKTNDDVKDTTPCPPGRGKYQIFGFTLGRSRSLSQTHFVPRIGDQANDRNFQQNPNDAFHHPRQPTHCPPPADRKYTAYMPFRFRSRQAQPDSRQQQQQQPTRLSIASTATVTTATVPKPLISLAPTKRHQSYVGDGFGLEILENSPRSSIGDASHFNSHV